MCLWSTKNTQGARISNSEEVREGCMEEETLEQKEYKLTGAGMGGQRKNRDEGIPISETSSHKGMEVWNRDVNDSKSGKQVCLAGA